MRLKYLFFLGICLFFFSWSFLSAHLLDITQYHFSYAVPVSWIFSHSQNSSLTLWWLFDQSKKILQINLITLLDQNNRKDLLHHYIAKGNILIHSYLYQENLLELKLQDSESRITSCNADYEVANEAFSQVLSTHIEESFLQTMDSLKIAKTCLAHSEVDKRVFLALLQKARAYRHHLELQIMYLEKNFDLIVQHFNILKPSLLKELHAISLRLENQENYHF